MTNVRKKLIEVALPLNAINEACKDDKDRKTGHIRNLHKWFAPMPLPAWRAALFASLVDDPGTNCDEATAAAKRNDLFQMIERILPLDAAKSPALFAGVRKVLRDISNETITVMDPFCGGGSTLLEAQRLGLRTIGADLNPIPFLITTCLTRYPSLFADVRPVNPDTRRQQAMPRPLSNGLIEDVKYYAKVIGERARLELANFFSELLVTTDEKQQRATVLSWIWTRTVQCPNPACKTITPLASSFELTRSVGSTIACWIEPRVETSNDCNKVFYAIRSGSGHPPLPPKLGRGTKFRCVACPAVIEEKYLREQAQHNGLGFDVMACVAKLSNGKRLYLAPTDDIQATMTRPTTEWAPELELSNHPQYMGAPRYGMRMVKDLFTQRQLKTIEVFARNVRAIRSEVEAEAEKTIGSRASEYAAAVVTILALCVSKLSQSHNVLVRWKIDSRNGSGKPLPAFDTQTVPIVWDFAENNPFGGSVGDWAATVVPTALRAFEYSVPDAPAAEIYHADARDASGIGHGPVVLATDPPYYDNVPYADLSDVFYPLLRFMLHDVHPQVFATLRAPRSNELVADTYRFDGNREKAREYFLNGFREVFAGIRPRILSDTPMTVVYSFRQQETRDGAETASTGWEVMLRALLEAGFMVTATWPVRTTLENRSRDIDSNALASAILIVCRPRSDFETRATLREFLTELREELPGAIRRLQAHSIAPVDLQQAMIGPGMAIFSKYVYVLDTFSQQLSVRDALALINQTLDEVLAEQEGDFDTDTRWALTWFEQFGFTEGEYGVAETLSKAKNTSISGMANDKTSFLISKAGKVRIKRPSEMPEDWDPATDVRLTVWEIVHQLIRKLEAGGERAAAELVAKLGSKAEVARELAYRLYTICERKKRAQEALSYNGLVQSWPEVIRLAREGAGKAPAAQAQMFAQE